jgi:hypothetical protein
MLAMSLPTSLFAKNNHMKTKWKKIWAREYKVTGRYQKERKYSTFRITKYVHRIHGSLYFASHSPKRTCGTSHSTFGYAFQFANKGGYTINSYTR